MSSTNKKYFIFLFVLFIFIAALYIHNLSRSVYGGDVGDLVTAATVGGVAHPPGYPLFTFLGFILTRLSINTPAFMVGLISAVSSALGVLIFYFFINKLAKDKLISIITSLTLAFSYLFWFYAEIAEVFALNNLFVILLFYLAVLYRENKKDKTFFFLTFFAGLSLTNHQTIILIFPSILILVFPNLIKVLKKPKTLISCILFFILGFSVYIYVPIASSFNPIVNWDHVKDFQSFIHLLLRKDYGTFNAGIFNSTNILQRLIILKTYLVSLIVQLTPPVIALIIIGSVATFIKDKKLFVSLVLAFFLSGPLFIGYAGFPLFNSFFIGIYERFFILSSIILLIFFPFGLIYIVKLLNNLLNNDRYASVFKGFFIIIPLLLLYYNFPKTNLNNVWIGDNLAYDFLSPLPANSVLFLSGDTALFNTWYVHYSKKFRSDLQVVNLNGLAGDAYLELEKKNFLRLYPQYQNDKDLIVQVIEKIAKKRPVFSYQGIQPKNSDKIIWVPYGLSFKLKVDEPALSKDEFFKKTKNIWDKLHVPRDIENKNLTFGSLSIADIPSIYANALLATGNYFLSEYKDKTLAYQFYQDALRTDPNYSKNYQILGVYYLSNQQCKEAEESLIKTINLSPFDKLSYYFLYTTYKTCIKSETRANQVINNYEKVFKTNFLKDLEGIVNNYSNLEKK